MDPQVNKDTDDARAGNTPHIVRYVLIISTVLAVLVLGALVLLR
jgi:hypothetical protein